jgi:hypothetical protein
VAAEADGERPLEAEKETPGGVGSIPRMGNRTRKQWCERGGARWKSERDRQKRLCDAGHGWFHRLAAASFYAVRGEYVSDFWGLISIINCLRGSEESSELESGVAKVEEAGEVIRAIISGRCVFSASIQ